VQLSIVVPCYNEEEVFPETAQRLGVLLARLTESGKVAANSKIVFVDDGSRDRTWTLIEEMAARDSWFEGLKLSRNRGHQNALLAGLLSVDGDALVSIDADLQDDINAIEEMVDRYHDGYDVVYGVRSAREADTAFKRLSAQGYYRLLGFFGVDVVFNHADFRLMSRRVVEALRQYGEVNLFLRGLIPLLGHRSTSVYYARTERFAGESKYPLRRMLSLAVDGITSFSAAPLRHIAVLGIFVSLMSVGIMGWVLWIRLFTEQAVPGWASSVLPIYFIGGVQLLSIGILGEYVAKLYAEAKNRPRYFVEKHVGGQKSASEPEVQPDTYR